MCRLENIIGNSPGMLRVCAQIRQVAQAETTVLLLGESGTGKELAASTIHWSSHRAQRRLVKVNCAGFGEGLLESELFGDERGSVAGDLRRRVGRIEEAEGSTLLLDEIGDLPPTVQVKLVRLLQDREFDPVGSDRPRKADVRMIVATSQDLESRVEAGTFREDLYYRVNVFPIVLPPLREHQDDILLLAGHFADRYAKTTGKPARGISGQAANAMLTYHWPGNVRELENCIEYAVLLSEDSVIHAHDLPSALLARQISATTDPAPFQLRMDLLAKDLILGALTATGGNMAAAARELGITPRMVRYKMKKLRIGRQDGS